MGLFVAFTAVIAFGSMYYLASTFQAPPALVPWIAAGYAIWVGALDREIAGSLDRTTAVVRPFLALFIATLVTIPIELGLFQQRVDQRLQQQYRINNKEQFDELRQRESVLEKRRSDLTATVDDLRKQESEWAKVLDAEAVGRTGIGRTGLAGDGPAFRNAQSQQASVRQRIQEARQDMDRLERSIPEEQRRQDAQFKREEVTLVTDFPSRYEALDKVIHESDPLYRLSWIIWAALTLIECCPALLKILTPHSDYHHLVQAEMRENTARTDELGERNFRLAVENPETPRLSVSEKLSIVKHTPIPRDGQFERRYARKEQA